MGDLEGYVRYEKISILGSVSNNGIVSTSISNTRTASGMPFLIT